MNWKFQFGSIFFFVKIFRFNFSGERVIVYHVNLRLIEIINHHVAVFE